MKKASKCRHGIQTWSFWMMCTNYEHLTQYIRLCVCTLSAEYVCGVSFVHSAVTLIFAYARRTAFLNANWPLPSVNCCVHRQTKKNMLLQ